MNTLVEAVLVSEQALTSSEEVHCSGCGKYLAQRLVEEGVAQIHLLNYTPRNRDSVLETGEIKCSCGETTLLVKYSLFTK